MVRGKNWGVFLLKRFFLALGYRIQRKGAVDVLVPLLHHLIEKKGRVSFIQIGANDGRKNDPLYEFVTLNYKRVNGLCVEPMKDFYEKLKANYSRFPNITPINVAIHNTAKEFNLYRVNPAKLNSLPNWAYGISSFNPDHHKRTGIPSECIIAEKVECLSLTDLLNHYHVSDLDPSPDRRRGV